MQTTPRPLLHTPQAHATTILADLNVLTLRTEMFYHQVDVVAKHFEAGSNVRKLARDDRNMCSTSHPVTQKIIASPLTLVNPEQLCNKPAIPRQRHNRALLKVTFKTTHSHCTACTEYALVAVHLLCRLQAAPPGHCSSACAVQAREVAEQVGA
jgi:hypothetical protein